MVTLLFMHQFREFIPRGFRFVLPTLTVPDQSLSLEELVLNNTVKQLTPVFDEDSELRDPRTYDIAEIEAMRRDLNARTQQATNDVLFELQSKKDEEIARKQTEARFLQKQARQARKDKLIEKQLGA